MECFLFEFLFTLIVRQYVKRGITATHKTLCCECVPQQKELGTPLVGNQEAGLTQPITAAVVTLPGFRGRTTINPADAERGNKRRKKQSKSETTRTDN